MTDAGSPSSAQVSAIHGIILAFVRVMVVLTVVAQFSSPHLARFTALSLGRPAKEMTVYAVILLGLAIGLGAAATLKQRRFAPA